MSIITPTNMIGAGLLGAVTLAAVNGTSARDALVTIAGIPAGLAGLLLAEVLRTYRE